MMKNIKLTDEQINNLIQFLDRVEYKGLQEVAAVSQLLEILVTDKQMVNNGNPGEG